VVAQEYDKPSNLLDCAQRLCRLGYYPVPIPAGCKGPTLPGWDKLRLKPEDCAAYFTEAGMLIGVLHTNVLALDVDVYDEDLARTIVDEALRRFPGALERIGEAPKSALFFRMDEPGFKLTNTEKHEKDGKSAQVEVRSVSRQIVVYGKHPVTLAPYRWPRGELWATPRESLPAADRTEIERFRDWCNDKIRKWAGVADERVSRLDLYPPRQDERPSAQAFREALRHVPAAVGYDEWLRGLMAIHDFYSGSAEGLAVAQDWSSPYAEYNPREVEAKWRSFEVGRGVSFKSIFHLAKMNGADMAAIARIDRPNRDSFSFNSGAPATRLDIPESTSAPAAGDEDWQDQLLRNSRGRPTWNVANAMLVLRNDPNLRECFAFDEFRQVKMITQPLPFSGERKDEFKGREIRDSDITKVVSYFNRIGYPEATKTVTADVIEAVGEMATFHPVRNYLLGLPEWDGLERVSTWLMDYCAAVPSDAAHARYIAEIGKRWLISAVARVMQPGCKADGVLILEGRQGAMKSTTLRTIAGAEWFGDSLPSMHTKDASDYLRGKWVIEMAELSNINKAEVEVVKAFIAREEERFRPAYGRNEITYPRQCVFAGSTNKTDYLRDETGNRRFWPVRVGDLCDVQSLQRDRDQIWAEALALFRDGAIWWLTGDIVKVAEAQQAERVSQDAWEGDILQYLMGRAEASCATIARDVLDIEVGRVDRAVTNRISAVLTGNGWVRKGQFTAGAEKGRARYIRAEDA
jgi:predicted P-loop ATPase